MTDPAVPTRPVPRWLHAGAILAVAITLVLLVLGQLVTTFRAGMADPVWPTEPWYVFQSENKDVRERYRIDFGFWVEHTHRIAGWSVGGVVSLLALGIWWTDPRRLPRVVGFVALVVLLSAFSDFHRQMIAQRDPTVAVTVPTAPVAVMTAALLTVVGIAVGGLLNGVRGSGLRLLAVATLVGVMIQGLLGGLRVRLDALIGTDFAQLHGVFAQVVFAVLVAQAVLTGRSPATEPDPGSRRFVGGLAAALVGLLVVQLIWGAMIRHAPNPLNQRLHLLTAFLVVAGGVWVLRTAFTNPAVRPRVAAAGWVLGVLLALQVALGVEAWMGKFGPGMNPETERLTAKELPKAVTRTAHVLVGTGVLAAAVALAVQVLRPAGAGRDEKEAGSSVGAGKMLAAVATPSGESP